MPGIADSARQIAAPLSGRIIGQQRAVAQVALHIAQWQEEPAPRFPLRLLFTGPTSVGKQLLASSIADTLFSGRLVVHSSFGLSGPLRLNHELRALGRGPLVLLLKLFDYGAHDLAAVGTLLTTGGIILGNGQSTALADSIVILSASQTLSTELADAAREEPSDGWTRTFTARFPWLANGLDGVVQLDPLGPDELVDIVAVAAAALSERAGIAIAVTDAAARAVARDQTARTVADVLACEVARVLVEPGVRSQLQSESRTLLVDHVDGDFRMSSVPAGATLPVRPVAARAARADIGPSDPPWFKPPPRPREFPALSWRGEYEFDAFISYKIRRHRSAARELRDALGRLGYKVWLDEDQIGAADDPWYTKTKQQLIDRLVHGVMRSRCTIVFEAQLEAVALPPGWSKADAEARGNVMHADGGALIAWNWQKLELDSCSHAIVIREHRPHLSVIDGVRDITWAVLGGQDPAPSQWVPAIARAIDHFKNA